MLAVEQIDSKAPSGSTAHNDHKDSRPIPGTNRNVPGHSRMLDRLENRRSRQAVNQCGDAFAPPHAFSRYAAVCRQERRSPMSELAKEEPEGHQGLYPLAEMTMLIARLVQPYGEPMRTTVDKVRKRILYATLNGALTTVGTGAGLYSCPQVIAWARKKWPGKLNDLQAEHSVSASATAGFRDDGQMFVTPGDLPRCQAALLDALREIQQLRTELKTAQAEIERLKPNAQKYELLCERNAKSAKLPRTRKL